MKRNLGSIKYWTPARILEEAKKYKQRGEWIKKSPVSYTESIKLGHRFHRKACKHMSWGRKLKNPPLKPHGYWTKERVTQEALKWGSFARWRKKSFSSYLIAYQRGWRNQIRRLLGDYSHGDVGRKYWTEKRIVNYVERSDYMKSMKDWAKESPSTFKAAKSLSKKNKKLMLICKVVIEKRAALDTLTR
jgi:hypothetical protein